MGGMFDMDGLFFRFGTAMADIIILSLLWIIFSIPIFTIGASTTALFYVTTRRISDREKYVFKDFLFSFRSNFKKATLLWILWVVVFGFIAFNFFVLLTFEFDPMMANILLPVQAVMLIEISITYIYLFPLTARFDMGISQTIKSAFFMANRHIFTTLSSIAAGIAIIIAATFFPPIFIIGMGLYAYVVSYMFMQLFRKYRPEIDSNQVSLQELRPIRDDLFEDEKEK